jgi:hypothetical protein
VKATGFPFSPISACSVRNMALKDSADPTIAKLGE